MTDFDIISGLDAAIRLIATTRKTHLSHGSTALWSKLDHAENYLDAQIKEMLKPVEDEVEA